MRRFLIAGLMLMLLPVTGFALQADSTAAPPALPSAEEVTGYLYTLVFILGLPWLISWGETQWPLLKQQSALVKRSVVFIVPGALTLGLKYAVARWPWLPIDLSYWNALMVSVGATGLHAASTAKDAKTLAATGEVKTP